MKINSIYKVRQVAGENIILLQGKSHDDLTRVVAFNDSALLMWNSLKDKDFTLDDATQVLLENYEVEESIARQDAQKWIDTIKENNLLLSE